MIASIIQMKIWNKDRASTKTGPYMTIIILVMDLFPRIPKRELKRQQLFIEVPKST